MTRSSLSAYAAAAIGTVLLWGCGRAPADTCATCTDASGDTNVGAVTSDALGSGDATDGATADASTTDANGDVHTDAAPSYPAGPYGIDVGSTIANYALQGFPAPAVATTLLPMQLADFYNPTGSGSYPSGSPYGSGPMPMALVIDVGAVWCTPCNEEAKSELPWRATAMQPAGQVFSILLNGPTLGTAATESSLRNWVRHYSVSYPMAIDPSLSTMELLGPPDAGGGFPLNLLVRTRDMKIVARVEGIADGPFWSAVESTISTDADLIGDAAFPDGSATD